MTFDERVAKIEMELNDTEDDIIDYIRNHRKEIQKLFDSKNSPGTIYCTKFTYEIIEKTGI